MNEQLLSLTDKDLRDLLLELKRDKRPPGLIAAVEVELEYRADMRMLHAKRAPWWVDALVSVAFVTGIAAVAWWWM